MIRANLKAGGTIDLTDQATNGQLVVGNRYMVLFASQSGQETTLTGLNVEQHISCGYNGYFAVLMIGTATANTIVEAPQHVGTAVIVNM